MKIEINKGCTSLDVSIDDESLFKHEYDKRSDDDISKLQQKLIDELSKAKDNFCMQDWETIIEILTSHGSGFEYDEENSKDYESCDQCGDYGYRHIYNKK